MNLTAPILLILFFNKLSFNMRDSTTFIAGLDIDLISIFIIKGFILPERFAHKWSSFGWSYTFLHYFNRIFQWRTFYFLLLTMYFLDFLFNPRYFPLILRVLIFVQSVLVGSDRRSLENIWTSLIAHHIHFHTQFMFRTWGHFLLAWSFC